MVNYDKQPDIFDKMGARTFDERGWKRKEEIY